MLPLVVLALSITLEVTDECDNLVGIVFGFILESP